MPQCAFEALADLQTMKHNYSTRPRIAIIIIIFAGRRAAQSSESDEGKADYKDELFNSPQNTWERNSDLRVQCQDLFGYIYGCDARDEGYFKTDQTCNRL